MTHDLRLIFTTLALFVALPAIAQIPPMHIKPTPVDGKDTQQQMTETHLPDYETLKDAKNGSVVFKGVFTYNELAKEPTFTWMSSDINEYKPKAKAIKYLKKNIGNYDLLIFLGTWCGDSKDLIPKLYKILGDVDVDYKNIMLVGMDRAKTTSTATGRQLVDKYKVTLLPTIILINKKGEEAGRITESVHKSVERDLTSIIKSVQ